MSQKDLDTILKEVPIGRYQIFVYFLLFISIVITGSKSVSYVFTAADLNYRCRIDECDDLNNPNSEYLPNWIRNAVPFDNDINRPQTCYKYNLTVVNLDDLRCEASDFNRVKIKCNDFVYENDKRTIVNDMDLQCDENKWLLALVGTIHNCGNFIHLLIIGFISDKYGRRVVFIWTTVASTTVGLLRTFAWNYPSFLVLEFLPPAVGGGIYVAGFLLLMEIVQPQYRAMSSAALFSSLALGKVFFGFSAMIYQDWRTILRVNLPLSYIALAYFWLLPESLRWLLTHKKHEEAAKTILKIIRVNKTEISAELRDLLENRSHDIVLNANSEKNVDTPQGNTLRLIFKYPRMLLRLVGCTICWMIVSLVFYGLSLMAVSIGGNKYIDFMLVQFIEIPASLSMPFISNRFGRKTILCTSFIICGISLFGYIFVGGVYGLKLALFLLGKFSIAIALTNMYIYYSEMFPTNMRNTVLGICSGIGRLGTIAAPQAPLLDHYVKYSSMYVFGSGALIAALVVLSFPETLNKKLPDTVEEAHNLGKESKVVEEKL